MEARGVEATACLDLDNIGIRDEGTLKVCGAKEGLGFIVQGSRATGQRRLRRRSGDESLPRDCGLNRGWRRDLRLAPERPQVKHAAHNEYKAHREPGAGQDDSSKGP
jgi:hypothetical protein